MSEDIAFFYPTEGEKVTAKFLLIGNDLETTEIRYSTSTFIVSNNSLRCKR